jgi:hypothetical protein
MRPKRPRRAGLAIIPALVCIVLVTLLCGSLLKQALTVRNLVRTEERRMQAEWLAESGLGRARARLEADPRYQGETWDVPAESLGGRATGVVRITVEPVENQSGRRRLRVEADYPRGEETRARQTKTLTVDFRPDTPGGPK